MQQAQITTCSLRVGINTGLVIAGSSGGEIEYFSLLSILLEIPGEDINLRGVLPTL
jgi:hypothetical protein